MEKKPKLNFALPTIGARRNGSQILEQGEEFLAKSVAEARVSPASAEKRERERERERERKRHPLSLLPHPPSICRDPANVEQFAHLWRAHVFFGNQRGEEIPLLRAQEAKLHPDLTSRGVEFKPQQR